MKLLLDEHYSPAIAEQLQERGYDVIPVAARMDAEQAYLRRRPDEDVLLWARTEGRVLVTENARDFLPIHRAWLSRGELHAGIVLTSPRKFSRRADGIGAIVRALAAFLESYEEQTVTGDIVWLTPAPSDFP